MKTLSKTVVKNKPFIIVSLTAAALLLAGCGGSAVPQEEMPDDEAALQSQQQTQQVAASQFPAEGWTLHVTTKKLFPGNPEMTVHKYCKSVVGNMMQCQLYDGNDGDSRLVGVETMVGPEMYATFTDEEKKLWMPTKDLMQTTMAGMPELDAEQFSNVANSLANKYSKVYLLWDPGKINLPTGSPIVTVMNTAVATGTTATSGTPAAPGTSGSATPNAAPASTTSSQPEAAPAPAPVSGGYTFAAIDLNQKVADGLDVVKGNFESSILQKNDAGSMELYKLKDRIGLHTYGKTSHVMFIVSGEGEFTLGDKKQNVKGGMLVIIPAGTPHAFKNLGGRDKPLVFMTFKTPLDEKDVKWLE